MKLIVMKARLYFWRFLRYREIGGMMILIPSSNSDKVVYFLCGCGLDAYVSGMMVPRTVVPSVTCRPTKEL